MTRRGRKATVKLPRRAAVLDLFGEVPVSRADVYAWLLGVVDLDPASHRAFDYVRAYGVLDKIVQAKLDGTFDEATRPVRQSARLRELQAQGEAVAHVRNSLGLGENAALPAGPLLTTSLKAKARPRELIEAERIAKAQHATLAARMRGSALSRLPKSIPPLQLMLGDLGDPSPAMLGHTLGVTTRTAARWVAAGEAPRSVMLALFWLTRWGLSEVDCRAQNDAMVSAAQASALRSELEAAQARLQKVGRIGEFGSANDPVPGAPLSLSLQAYEVPLAPMRKVKVGRPRKERLAPVDAVPLVITMHRRAPCADSGRARKKA